MEIIQHYTEEQHTTIGNNFSPAYTTTFSRNNKPYINKNKLKETILDNTALNYEYHNTSAKTSLSLFYKIRNDYIQYQNSFEGDTNIEVSVNKSFKYYIKDSLYNYFLSLGIDNWSELNGALKVWLLVYGNDEITNNVFYSDKYSKEKNFVPLSSFLVTACENGFIRTDGSKKGKQKYSTESDRTNKVKHIETLRAIFNGDITKPLFCFKSGENLEIYDWPKEHFRIDKNIALPQKGQLHHVKHDNYKSSEKEKQPSEHLTKSVIPKETLVELMSCILLRSGQHEDYHRLAKSGKYDANIWFRLHSLGYAVDVPYVWKSEENLEVVNQLLGSDITWDELYSKLFWS